MFTDVLERCPASVVRSNYVDTITPSKIKTEIGYPYETSGNMCHTGHLHFSEDSNLHIHGRENVISPECFRRGFVQKT
jgi:hypothetical protein